MSNEIHRKVILILIAKIQYIY